MRIAILGATSQIAKDLVLNFQFNGFDELVLYARRPQAVMQWLSNAGLSGHYLVADFEAFGPAEHFDAIVNFVGVGSPAKAIAMGSSILNVTLQYDDLALDYLNQHPDCRYIFLSSGDAYGLNFDDPVSQSANAIFPINALTQQNWYGVAKMHAECRHRSLTHLPIVDIRVFNYFSHTQDMSGGFFITDVLRAIHSKTALQVSAENIVRDYIHPEDFYQLVAGILNAPAINIAVDAYSKAPIDKSTLLKVISQQFKLQYELIEVKNKVNAAGSKTHYYSRNAKAADFGFKPLWTSLEGVLREFATYSRSLKIT
jgi:nucleoside-diphosphate-sugar epimerase